MLAYLETLEKKNDENRNISAETSTSSNENPSVTTTTWAGCFLTCRIEAALSNAAPVAVIPDMNFVPKFGNHTFKKIIRRNSAFQFIQKFSERGRDSIHSLSLLPCIGH